MTEKLILNEVIAYRNASTIRFHMPGHKGRAVGSYIDGVLGCDVTELERTDNLYEPQSDGAVENSEKRAAELFGTKGCLYSVAGATLALQTAIMASVIKTGSKKILCDRRAHMSAVNAMALCGCEPEWFFADEIGRLKPKEQGYACALITSPDYYGEIYDIAALRRLLPDTIIIADNSHGSHLAFHENGRLYAYKNGATLTVDSLHKTLPAMTGCALLQTDGTIAQSELREAMRIFASTSPSYIMMSSTDACISYMSTHKGATQILYEQIARTTQRLSEIGYKVAADGIRDPYRIYIKLSNGKELYSHLEREGIVCEFADAGGILLIPSVMNTKADFDALIKSCEGFTPTPPRDIIYTKRIPKQAVTIREAIMSRSKAIKTSDAVGRIAARMKAPYPPGIPIVMPGELIDKETAEILKENEISTVEVIEVTD